MPRRAGLFVGQPGSPKGTFIGGAPGLSVGGGGLAPPIPLLHWWDARTPGTLSGGNITSWPDLVGGNPATNTGVVVWNAGTTGILGKQPTWTAASSAFLTVAGTITLATAPFTLFVVCRSPAVLANPGFVWDSSGTAIRSAILSFTAGAIGFDPTSAIVSGPTITVNTDYVFALVMTNGAQSLYVNSSASAAATAAQAFSGAMKGCFMGDFDGGGPNNWGGPVMAYGLYNGAASTGTISSFFSAYGTLTGNAWS